jgi:hypothetical protein
MASKPDVLGAQLAGLPGCAGQLQAPEAHGLKPPLPFLLLLCSLLQVTILPPKIKLQQCGECIARMLVVVEGFIQTRTRMTIFNAPQANKHE